MNSGKSLATIYKVMAQNHGESKAREYISTTLFNILFDLQEDGIPVTEEAIQKRLQEEAEFCLKCSRNKDVA